MDIKLINNQKYIQVLMVNFFIISYTKKKDLVQEYIKANIFKYPFTNGISMKKKTSSN